MFLDFGRIRRWKAASLMLTIGSKIRMHAPVSSAAFVPAEPSSVQGLGILIRKCLQHGGKKYLYLALSPIRARAIKRFTTALQRLFIVPFRQHASTARTENFRHWKEGVRVRKGSIMKIPVLHNDVMIMMVISPSPTLSIFFSFFGQLFFWFCFGWGGTKKEIGTRERRRDGDKNEDFHQHMAVGEIQRKNPWKLLHIPSSRHIPIVLRARG